MHFKTAFTVESLLNVTLSVGSIHFITHIENMILFSIWAKKFIVPKDKVAFSKDSTADAVLKGMFLLVTVNMDRVIFSYKKILVQIILGLCFHLIGTLLELLLQCDRSESDPGNVIFVMYFVAVQFSYERFSVMDV